jgi:hypothetical protein
VEARIIRRSRTREREGEGDRTALAATPAKEGCCPLKPSIDINLPSTTLVLFVGSSIMSL